MRITSSDKDIYNKLVEMERRISTEKEIILTKIMDLGHNKYYSSPMGMILRKKLNSLFLHLYSYLGLEQNTNTDDLDSSKVFSPKGKTQYRKYREITGDIKVGIQTFIDDMKEKDSEFLNNDVTNLIELLKDINKRVLNIDKQANEINTMFTKYRDHPNLIELIKENIFKIEDN